MGKSKFEFWQMVEGGWRSSDTGEFRSDEQIKKGADNENKAYKRGVHQTIAILREYIETHPQQDPAAIMLKFETLARKFRSDKKPHPLLLHEILDELEKGAN